MAISESQEQLETQEPVTESVGEALRAARKRSNLSKKEVADRLHITVHYVRAIESNSFEKLPGAVFARGYIKSYALLLDLDENKLIGRYDDYVSDQKDAAREKTLIQVRRRKDKNRIWLVGSGIIFVGLLAGLWFFSGGSEDSVTRTAVEAASVNESNSSQSEMVSSAALNTEPEPTTVENSELLNPGSVDLSSLGAPQQGEALVSELQQPAIEQQVTEDAPNTGAEIVSALLESMTDDPDSLNQGAQELEAADSERRILVEAEGEDVLLISFKGDSWIEVSDGFENLIYKDLREAGNVLEITGTAPFNILLGDAPFAELTLNGAEIDMTESIRIDNSARLTVGL